MIGPDINEKGMLKNEVCKSNDACRKKKRKVVQ